MAADGGGRTVLATEGLLHPWGLAWAPDGHLYGSDFVNDRVVRVAVGSGGQQTVPTTGLT